MHRPNILLITTDQQRFDTINALGNKHILTPHMNWLCDEGITYTRAYADCPICMPSRATIMTGLAGYHNDIVTNVDKEFEICPTETLAGMLTQNGYQTRAQGKMHFYPMRKHNGFETMEISYDYYRECNKNLISGGLPKQHGLGENEYEPVISTVEEKDSLTNWVVRRSIDFLETRDETRPFFLWTSFSGPHAPYDPAPNFWELYRDKTVPESVYGDWSATPDMIPVGLLGSTYSGSGFATTRLSDEFLTDTKRAYYAKITQIDYAMGMLFARLRELDLLENTWIIFTSDHGDMMGDHYMTSKGEFLEGSAHIPFIIKPPFACKDLANSSIGTHPLSRSHCDTIVTLSDIMPTILSMAGIQMPQERDGRDVLPFIKQPDPQRKFYGDFKDSSFAIIEGRYKYIWCNLGGAELLFDLEKDPYEKENLIEKAGFEEIADLMRNQMLAFVKQAAPDKAEGNVLKVFEAKKQGEVQRWPGFHSPASPFPSDLLH